MRAAVVALALCCAGAANGAVLAEVVADDERVELHDEAGPCQGAALWSVYYRGRERVSGCWVLSLPDKVAVAWLDGTYTLIPVRVFRKPQPL